MLNVEWNLKSDRTELKIYNLCFWLSLCCWQAVERLRPPSLGTLSCELLKTILDQKFWFLAFDAAIESSWVTFEKFAFFTRNRVYQVILKVTSSISYFVLFINRKGQFLKFPTFVVPFPVANFESWIKNSSFWTGHYHSFSPLSVLGH